MTDARSMPLILASASARRAQLLEQIGLRFTVVVPDIDETPRSGETPEALVIRLAEAKARAIAVNTPNAVVIGSDTVVALGSRVYGKPADTREAADMLASLSNTMHRVASGVSVCVDGAARTRVCVSEVTMRAIGAEEIEAYGRTGEPMGKAGGYAIQGRGALFVQKLVGSYSAVMGLPLFETGELLSAAGVCLFSGDQP